MSRINTNINSLIAQRSLRMNQNNLSTTLQRLSTGLQINSGKDNPSGLIASEALKSQEAAQQAAIGNTQAADQMANVADGSLGQINSALIQLQSLVTQTANDAGLSATEKSANQQQIDSILQSIDRIANTTSFKGTKLLNGSLDFTLSSQDTNVKVAHVNAATLPDANLGVNATITQSAQHAALWFNPNNTNLGASSTFVFDLAGTLGSREFSFSSNVALTSMAAQINNYKSTTGVSAIVSGNKGINMSTVEYGSSQFVSINIVKNASATGQVQLMLSNQDNKASTNAADRTNFSAVNTPIKDAGQDVGGVVNGVAAFGSGATLKVDSNVLKASINLSSTLAQARGTTNLFTITGGGATFSLGASVDANNMVTLGLDSVASRALGKMTVDNISTSTKSNKPTLDVSLADLASGKALNVEKSMATGMGLHTPNGDINSAQKVVNAAISQISQLRGRIGSFQKNIVQTALNTMNVAYENTSAAQSQITDTNFAQATANLTRNQILVQAATQSLKLSNQQPQQVLTLLG